MNKKFELIIFDWDGTLADSTDWIVQCMQQAAKQQGLDVPEVRAVKAIIGLSIHKALDKLFPEIDGQTKEQFIVHYSQEFFSKPITEADLFSGVGEMLYMLKEAGYKLAVATGKGRSGLDKAMNGTGLSGFFDITRCADETASKPDPAMVYEIIEVMGVNASQVVMIGDSGHDMQMAINAGIEKISVACGADSAEQLRKYKPLFELSQTTELTKFFKGE